MDELTPQKGTDMPLVATETKAPEIKPEPTTISSEQPKNAFVQMLTENKKIVIIGVIAVAAVVIGLSVLIGAKSSSEYQGLIKRIDTQTQELNKASKTDISSPSAIDNSIPFEMEGTPAANDKSPATNNESQAKIPR